MLELKRRQQSKVLFEPVPELQPSITFSSYVKEAWSVVEPATLYSHNWHIDILSDYLTAIVNHELQNLIINIPMRHMKSLLVCVMFPTWVWTFAPAKRFLSTSYAESLAVRDALKSRRIIQSAWYQSAFGKVFQLTGDQNVKGRYENNKTGYRIAMGLSGSVTGEGGDVLLVDDPLNATDADSETVRETANQDTEQMLGTRANDPKTVARIVIMQRLHTDDPTGRLLEKMKQAGANQYEHLVLPAEYEPHRFHSVLGFKDKRTLPGELLWADHIGRAEIDAIKVSLGERGAAGQLQQRPAPAGGATYLREWWGLDDLGQFRNRYNANDIAHANLAIARWLIFDTALKDKAQNDYSALTVFELQPDYRVTTRRVEQKKLQFPQLVDWISDEAKFYNRDSKLRGIVIEDKVSGTSAIQTLRQSAASEIAQFIIEFPPHGSKTERNRQASLWCERGCILLPYPDENAPWLFDFEESLYKYPGVAHDDREDTFSEGIIYLEHFISEGYWARLMVEQGHTLKESA